MPAAQLLELCTDKMRSVCGRAAAVHSWWQATSALHVWRVPQHALP